MNHNYGLANLHLYSFSDILMFKSTEDIINTNSFSHVRTVIKVWPQCITYNTLNSLTHEKWCDKHNHQSKTCLHDSQGFKRLSLHSSRHRDQWDMKHNDVYWNMWLAKSDLWHQTTSGRNYTKWYCFNWNAIKFCDSWSLLTLVAGTHKFVHIMTHLANENMFEFSVTYWLTRNDKHRWNHEK
jgi:hypothetical protein